MMKEIDCGPRSTPGRGPPFGRSSAKVGLALPVVLCEQDGSSEAASDDTIRRSRNGTAQVPSEIPTMTLSLVIMAASVTILADLPPLQRYDSKAGQFQIDLPGTPKVDKQSKDTEAGRIEVITVAVEDEPNVFAVLCLISPDSFGGADTKAVVEKRARELLNKFKDELEFKLVKSREIRLAGHTGRELEFKYWTPQSGDKAGYVRIHKAGNRLDQVLADVVSDEVSAVEAKQVVGSFKLKDSE
jgi:hypothetical protein